MWGFLKGESVGQACLTMDMNEPKWANSAISNNGDQLHSDV